MVVPGFEYLEKLEENERENGRIKNLPNVVAQLGEDHILKQILVLERLLRNIFRDDQLHR